MTAPFGALIDPLTGKPRFPVQPQPFDPTQLVQPVPGAPNPNAPLPGSPDLPAPPAPNFPITPPDPGTGTLVPPPQPPGAPQPPPLPGAPPLPNFPITPGPGQPGDPTGGGPGYPNAPPPPPAPPPIPGATPFGPNQNLIGTQFNPQAAADTAAARAGVGQQYGALQSAPDRAKLAADAWKEIAAESEPAFQQELRGVGQRAAAYGRLGSGMTTSELGDVESNRQKYLGNLQAELATGAAGQTLQDRLSQLRAGQGVLGQLSGLDQTAYGNLTGERGYEAGLAQQAYDNALAAAGLTQPNPLGLNIAGNYAAQGQNAFAGAGDLLRLLFQGGGQSAYGY